MEHNRCQILCQHKKYFIVLLIAGVAALFCVIRLLLPRQVYVYDGTAVFETGTAAAGRVIYDGISLKPGVYKVQLEYQTDTDFKNYCTVFDGTVYSGGLLTNGEALCQGRGRTDYTLWLYESTDDLQIRVDYGGEGYFQTDGLVIRETGQLWSMLLTIVVGVTLALFGFWHLLLLDRTQKTLFFWGAVIVLIASLPYLTGNNFAGIDLVFHLERIEGVKDGILSGHFPVRLSPEWIYGYGYADGVMYCNALLIFPAVLRMLGFTVLTSYNIYCIALNVATVWIAYYCFSKIFKNQCIGMICSALYSLSVFRIYKLVITAATGEGSAVTFMPLVLYGYFRVFTENPKEKAYKTAWAPLALGYAGLIQTHVLTCEITVFLTVAMCLVLIKKIFCKETFWELCKGAAAAIAISFWFLVPFLDFFFREDLHIRHVAARKIQSVGLYPAQLAFHYWKIGNNSVGGGLGMRYSYPMGIGLCLVIGFVVYCILWFSGKWREGGKNNSIVAVGNFSAVFGGLLMLMSLEVFPWDKIQSLNGVFEALVGSLEFPHRFLGWGTVFLVCVFGCCLCFFRERADKWCFLLGIVTALAGITTCSMYLLDYIGESDAKVWIYNEEGMGFAFISDGEYLVQGTDANLLTFKPPQADEDTEILSYEKEYLDVRLTCRNTGGEEGYVELPMLYYTGYQAYSAKTGERLEVVKGDNNVVRVVIPAQFTDTIEVKYVSPVHWRFSEAVSYAGWLAMAAGGFLYYEKRRRRRRVV